MKTIYLSILTMLFFQGAWAQTTISGTVKDSKQQVLTGANIYLEGTYDGTTSDFNGNFILTTDERGEQLLVVEFIGYEKKRTIINLNGQNIKQPIELKEAFNELSAVTISAGTFEAGDTKKSVKINSIDMVTTAGSSGNLYAALQSLPGTTTVGESGKLFVKGGDSRESKTFIDGTLVHIPYSSSSPNSSVRSRFSPFMFSGTMFSTGGYSAEFGQALSSVLSLKTHEKAVEDQLNISLLTVGGELGGTKSWENASLTATGTYNNLGPYMKVVPQNTVYNAPPETVGGEASYRLQTPKSGLLKLYTNLSQSKLATQEQDLANPGETFNYNLINNNLFMNASWKGELKKHWILSTGLSHTQNEDKVSMDDLNVNEKLQGTHAKAVLKHKINKQFKLIAGSELNFTNYQVATEYQSAQYKNNYKGVLSSTFIESEIHSSQNFVSRIGARFEYDNYLNKANLAPRLSTAYKLNKQNQLSLSYGWFFQNPESEFLLYTNHLNYERADHYTLNYIHTSKGRTLRSELYYKNYSNLLKYGINRNSNYDYLNNSGYGSAYGLDIFWRDRESIKYLEYWISYSYINTERNYLNYPNTAQPNFASKHNLNAVLKYWIAPLRTQLGVAYNYASPRAYNNPNSEVFNAEKTTAYHSLDANFSYLHRQNIIFHFSINNILGYEHQYGERFSRTPDESGHYNSTTILPGAKRFILLGCFITLSKRGDVNQMDKIN